MYEEEIQSYDLVKRIKYGELTPPQKKKVLKNLYGMPEKEVMDREGALAELLVERITNQLKGKGVGDPMMLPVAYSNIHVVLSDTAPVIQVSAISEVEEPLLRLRLMRLYFFAVEMDESHKIGIRVPKKEDRTFMVVRNNPNDPRKVVYFKDIVVSMYNNTFAPCTIVKHEDTEDHLVIVFSDQIDNSRRAIISLCGMRNKNMVEFVMQMGKVVVYTKTCKICCSPTRHKCICGARLCSPFCQRLDYDTHGKVICQQRKPLP